MPNESQRFAVTARLDAAPENREDARIFRGKKLRRHSRDGSRSHFRDQSPVHHGERRACFRIDQKNRRHVGRYAAIRIRRIEGDNFHSESIRQRRH